MHLIRCNRVVLYQVSLKMLLQMESLTEGMGQRLSTIVPPMTLVLYSIKKAR